MLTNLSYTGFQKQWNTEEDIEHVVKDLNANINSLTTLQLSGNTLGVKAAEKLTEPLSHQSKLENLIWNDLFTGRLKTEISVALTSLSTGLLRAQVNLVELDLSDNAFGPHGVAGVTELLASSCCYTLKTLNMNNQGLGHQGCRQLVDALKKARTNSNYKGMNLEVFVAGRNRLENAGIKMLTEVFSDGMTSMKKIVLLQNGIGIHGIEGVDNLILSLKNHINLKVLNISDNTIKPEGVKRLGKILPYFEQLEELYLGDCLIGNNGLDHLTKIIDSMSLNLRSISVSGNEITGRSAREFISTLLQTKHEIQKIDLTENEIKKSALREIRDIAAEYDKLEALIEEEENSDEEASDNESGDEDGSDESSNEGDSSAEDDEEEGEYSDETNHSDSESCLADEKEETKAEGGLFSFAKPQQSIFSNKDNSNKPSLFNGTAQSNLFAQRNIFKTSDNTSEKNIFGTPTTKPFSFLDAANNSKSINVETKAPAVGGLFGQSQTNKPFVFTKNIDSNKPSIFSGAPVANGTAQSNLFASSNQTNLFKSADSTVNNIFGIPNTKPFSFLAASANPSVSLEREIVEYVSTNIQSISLMTIKESKLSDNKPLGNKFPFDATVCKLAEEFPENAVRIGLMLCKNNSSFNAGVGLINYLLMSKSAWKRATNSILVEMDCIKCEEKKFVPFSKENDILPIKVLNSVLEMNAGLPSEVKTNLTVVLKNLTKKSNDATDELLKKLESCVTSLRI